MALENPAPEKSTLAFLDIFAKWDIFVSVLCEFLNLCLSICFLIVVLLLKEKSTPRSLVFSFCWYVIPTFLSSFMISFVDLGSLAIITPLVLSVRFSFLDS